ncbi:hypothetical protein niasHT_036389 [Heterodera trifolii]|uniref:Ragulator complex protein LAMTOR1 n=1 Tax=Heterodera trifolii TaxID=157864 RepID=A0ABD2INJ6_9BILA
MPLSTFVQMLRKYCCCKGTSSMDYARLVTDGGQTDEYTAANSNGATALSGSLRAGISESGSVGHSRSREEEEEELMNKILDRTQQCIIDVTNLDNGSLDFDLVQRSRLYSEAVKRHDAVNERRRGLLSNDGGGDGITAAVPSLLVSLGPFAIESLSRHVSPATRDELAFISRIGENFLDAHRLGAQIECNEELIVYMSWDE